MRRFVPFAAAAFALVPLGPAGALCIQAYNIDTTEVPNDSVILFHMKNGTTYRNDLPQRCVGLKAAPNGFSYEPTDPATDEICDNLEQIRINEEPGAVCLMGAFTKLH